MNLYIEIENGKPISNPYLEDNLLDAFNYIPENYEKFVRKIPNFYYSYTNPPTYEKVNGLWTDILITNSLFDELNDEDKYKWSTQPTDGKNYDWRPVQKDWIEIPPKPDDGKFYSFRLQMGIWDEYDPVTDKFLSDGVSLNSKITN